MALAIVFLRIALAIGFVLVAVTVAAAQSGDLDRAAALTEAALQLNRQGRSAEAISLAQEALAIREKALGADHIGVAQSLNTLALVYGNQGRYAEAEPLYQRSLAIYEKALGPEHPGVGTSINNLAELYRSQGRYAEAEALHKRALAIREKALGPDHPDVAQSLNNLAVLYRNLGRYAEAEPLYRRSLAIREQALGADHPDVAGSLNNLAELYRSQARYAEAEPLFKRSLEISEKALGADHPSIAFDLNNLATLYRNQDRFAEAEPLFKRSLAIFEKRLGSDHPNVAQGLNNLAELYVAQARYAEAEPLYQRSLAIREKTLGPGHPDVATSLNNLAQLYQIQSRFAEAEPLYRRSLAIGEGAFGADHPVVAAAFDNLGALYLDQGRYADGLNLSRRAVGIANRQFGEASAHRAGATDAQRHSKRFFFLRNLRLVHAANQADATAESFRVAQMANNSSAAQAVAGMATRFAAGSDALAAVVRERQDLLAQRQRIDTALIAAAARPSANRDKVAEESARAQLAEMAIRLEAIDARMAREFPSYAELSNPKPLELAEAQALLARDEAMLVYVVADREVWLWALRRDRAELYQIDLGAKELAGEVQALRSRLDPTLNSDLAPFLATRANRLYQKIVLPAGSLLQDAHQVFVVPDGALESLPFEVLVTDPPAADPRSLAAHRLIVWFGRDHALTVLPSVSALRSLRRLADAVHAEKAFAGIGNPVLGGTPGGLRGITPASLFRGALADVDVVRALPPLPETAEELRAVAKAMGADDKDLFLGERASEPILRQAGLDHYRIVEFATHGLMSGDLAGLAEPALVLTPPAEASRDDDGLLTASKVATLKLNADWVVLSACNTAASDGTPDAGGLSGLAKAFFYAGARSLLVSHWEVPSEATARLVSAAFNELKTDPTIGRAEALRRAELAMLDPKNPPEFAHPLVWAPFVLAGEGGPGR